MLPAALTLLLLGAALLIRGLLGRRVQVGSPRNTQPKSGPTLAKRIRRIARTALYTVCFAFLIACRLPGCVRGEQRDNSTVDTLNSGAVRELQRTIVAADLDQPLVQDRSVLWCATFQLAWNECCTLIGEDVHFDSDPPMVAALNARRVTSQDIDGASCVAMAGWAREGIVDRIRTELQSKFSGAAMPQLIPDRTGLRPQDIVFYAYLYKRLDFPARFERMESPLYFDGNRVASFGIGPYKSAQRGMYGQVAILDYQSENDFVIELTTTSADDQVVLAKIAPQSTLQSTIDRALSQVRSTPVSMGAGDILQVPKFNFDVRREFTEILGRRLRVSNLKVARDLRVIEAVQDIRFQMNESGVTLRSEAAGHFGCGVDPLPQPPTHVLIFDKPFLVLLKRRTANQPYFAMWVENADLLVHQAAD